MQQILATSLGKANHCEICRSLQGPGFRQLHHIINKTHTCAWFFEPDTPGRLP